MKGTFRFYYREGDVEQPCVGVNYQVANSAGMLLAAGKTDASGQTKPFDGLFQDDDYAVTVQLGPGRWEAPPTVSGTDAATTMHLPGPQTPGAKLQKVRIEPYHQARFVSHADHKPIAGATYTAYALDANGTEGVARDSKTGRPITGSTDGDGKTAKVYCPSALTFKFQIPGTSVEVRSSRLQPLLPGQAFTLHDVPLKTVRASTAIRADHAVQMSGKTSPPILISPQDSELILIGQSDYEEFEEASGRLDKIIAAMHLAKLDLSRALESGQKAEIEAAEKALAGAEDKVKSELNKNFSKSADLKEVITLESYSKGPNSSTGAAQMGLRRRYLRTDKYMQLRNKRLNQTEYKLNVKFAGPAGSKAGAEVKPKSLDVAALKQSFAKIKTSLTMEKKWEADPKVLNLLDLAGNQYAETMVQSDTYQVDAQAQWLRLVGGCGASAQINWKEKKAQLQGNLQGKFVLCEGKVTGQWAVPSLKGWMIELAGEDLGAVRFVVEVSGYGFAGAKVVATGTVGITFEQGQQVAYAIARDPKESFGNLMHPTRSLPKFDPMAPYEAPPKNLNGVDVGIDAFAGAEAGITPAGKIQWLPPQEKEFVSFAEVSATLAGNAGVGLSASLAVYYDEGKFRVRAAARLCWGLGGKGALEFTVDGARVVQFVNWMRYQLLYAGFRKLLNIERGAFSQFSRLLVLLVKEGCGPQDAERIEAIASTIDEAFGQLEQDLETAKQRDALVKMINRGPHWLVHATPETRGILLYQIVHHGLFGHMRDTPSVEFSIDNMVDVHFLPEHKKAVCTIMKTVQTAAEWDNVMQHMTTSGAKSSKSSGQNEGDVLRFLNNGVALADLPSVFDRLNRTTPVMEPFRDKKGSGNAYLDEYLAYRGKLLDKFPKGYKVAALDAPEFEMLAAADGSVHPQFAQIQTACIGEAFAGDPGASVA